LSGPEVAVAGRKTPDEADGTGRAGRGRRPDDDEDLARRKAVLEAALAVRNRKAAEAGKPRAAGSAAGFATALKLSSEFIGAILVGAAIGWLIDRVAGTSPWGMIVLLLLGFCAGILNVLRSAGVLAEQAARRDGAKAPEDR
jgi:ATP synthase protein I